MREILANRRTSLFSLISALKECSSSRDVLRGKDLHGFAIKASYESDSHVASLLLTMYSKCGSMVHAQKLFDTMAHHDVVSWTALLLGYADNSEGKLALILFEQMRIESCLPDSCTFVACLKACASMASEEDGDIIKCGRPIKANSLRDAMLLHSQARSCLDIFVDSTLIDTYAKCGSMLDSRRVFDTMPCWNTVSWNSLLLGYVENREEKVALDLFRCMGRKLPNERTFAIVLKACGSLAEREELKDVGNLSLKLSSLENAMEIHSRARVFGFQDQLFVASGLIDTYRKCGSMLDARSTFDRMFHHDVVCWNSLVMGFADNGEEELSLELFERFSCQQDTASFVAAFKACSSLAAKGTHNTAMALEKGRSIHGQAQEYRYDEDIQVASSIVQMYSKCGSMEEAERAFNKSVFYDVVLWTSLVLGYVENRREQLAMEAFARMKSEGSQANARTFLAVLKACTRLAENEDGAVKVRSLEKGMDFHSQAVKGRLELDIFVANMLLDMYAKCGSMYDARVVFDKMAKHDCISWSTLILGYARNGEPEVGLEVFEQLNLRVPCEDVTLTAALKACASLAVNEEGRIVDGRLVKLASLERCRWIHSLLSGFTENGMVMSTLVYTYTKCGSIEDAQQLFESCDDLRHDVVLWTSLTLGYVENMDSRSAFKLLARMKAECLSPADMGTYVAILKACGAASALEVGKQVHAELCRSCYGLDGNLVLSCLVDMYGKSGDMVASQQVFDSSVRQDSVMWTALLSGYGRQADVDSVFRCLELMRTEGVQVDEVTLVGVLAACSHSGQVEKGRECLSMMGSNLGIGPGTMHYTCIVDMLGRANRLDDALEMLKKLPSELVAWRALLGACHKWRDVAKGRLAFEYMLEFSAKDAAGYNLMANLTSIP